MMGQIFGIVLLVLLGFSATFVLVRAALCSTSSHRKRLLWPAAGMACLFAIWVIVSPLAGFFFSAPYRVFNTRAPVPSSAKVFFPDDSGILSVNARDGSFTRQYNTKLGIYFNVDKSTIYNISQDNNDNTGTISALRVADGSILWRFTPTIPPVPEEFPLFSFAGVSTTDKMVYISVAFDHSVRRPSISNHIYAIHTSDGTLAWSVAIAADPQTFDAAGEPASSVTLAVDAGVLIVKSLSGGKSTLQGLHASDGTQAWHSNLDGEPTVTGAFVILCTYGPRDAKARYQNCLLTLLLASDGSELWSEQTTRVLPHLCLPTISGLLLYLCGPAGSTTASNRFAFYAFNLYRGDLQWKYLLPFSLYRANDDRPIEDGGMVILSYFNTLFAWYANDGKLLWQYQTKSDADFASLALTNGVIFVAVDNWSVYTPGCILYTSCGRYFAVITALRASDHFVYWTAEEPLNITENPSFQLVT